jgi:hypothetical protein
MISLSKRTPQNAPTKKPISKKQSRSSKYAAKFTYARK